MSLQGKVYSVRTLVMAPFKKLPYETCWQFMNCLQDMRIACIVYKTNYMMPCWIMNQVDDEDFLCSCKSCPWFLKNNPDLHD